MTAGERFAKWIDDTATFFSDRLKGWLSGTLAWGLEVLMDTLGKAFAPKLKPIIEELEQSEDIPDWILPILKEIKEPTGEVGAFLAQSAGGALVGGALGSIMDALFLRFAYSVNSRFHPVIANENQIITFWLRGFYDDAKLEEELRKLGADNSKIAILKELSHLRLPPEMVMRLWLRNKEAYEPLWKELEDSGVSPDRITYFKELAYAMPTPQDVTNFMAHEALEEEMVRKYGLDAEWETVDLKWFERAGIKPELAKLYWRNHWQHPAFREITELLHRGELTDEDVYDWYRLVEIPPLWRDKLTAISWDLPNRIELRMMARYGLVDKSFLVEQLKQVGLKEDFRDVAADMMLAMGIRTDLSTRYSKGWLTAEEVNQELIDSGLSEAVRTRMYQWIVKNAGTDRVEPERNLTKAEIIKGVKKGVISWIQGVELLEDMNYDRWEAEFMLEINIGAMEGSPETYQEFRKLTQLYRHSQGLLSKVPSAELIEAEKSVLMAEDAIRVAKEEKAPKKRLQALTEDLEAAKILYHQLVQANE